MHQSNVSVFYTFMGEQLRPIVGGITFELKQQRGEDDLYFGLVMISIAEERNVYHVFIT